jgi:hypothetical protein
LQSGVAVDVVLDQARRLWLDVACGAVDIFGLALSAGDALGFADEGGTNRWVGQDDDFADVLLFDLPA